MQWRLEQIDESIFYYLSRLDGAALQLICYKNANSFVYYRQQVTTYATLSTTLSTTKAGELI
jgi:hypothetical protein